MMLPIPPFIVAIFPPNNLTLLIRGYMGRKIDERFLT
jgi:hypothetical protein